MAVSSDAATGTRVASLRTSDAIPANVDSPWTGEAAAQAVDAWSVAHSNASGAEVSARSSLPDRPWGIPRLPLEFWLVAPVILVVAAIALLDVSAVAAISVGVVAIVALVPAVRGIYVSWLEWRIAQAARAARSADEKPLSSTGEGR